MSEPKISDALALTYVRQLGGLRGYPVTEEAVQRLAHVLAEHCISVEHARYVMDAFNEWCPTPAGLQETLNDPTVRERFGEKPKSRAEQEAEWIAEGATYDPNWSAEFLGQARAGTEQQFDLNRRQAMLDTLWYTEGPPGSRREASGYWADARKRFETGPHAAEFRYIREAMSWPDAWDPYDVRGDKYGMKASNFGVIPATVTASEVIAQRAREWHAVVDKWRAEDPQRRRNRYPKDPRVAQLRKELGFDLTPWDKQVLEGVS